eukprot:Gb_36401 [translate_table: standard]
MVISKMWTDWRQSSSDDAIQVRRMILNDQFWVDAKFILDVIEPTINVIRYGDTDSPCLNEVYETLDSMCEQIRTIADRKDKELYKTLEEKIHKRWNLLNTPLHMATYVVNPKWYDTKKTRKRVPCSDVEVARGFMACIKKIYGGREEGVLIRRQFVKFVQGRHEFGTNEAKNDLSMTDPIDWTLHGTKSKEL